MCGLSHVHGANTLKEPAVSENELDSLSGCSTADPVDDMLASSSFVPDSESGDENTEKSMCLANLLGDDVDDVEDIGDLLSLYKVLVSL